MSSAITKRAETTARDRLLAVMESKQDKYTCDTALILRTVRAHGIDLFSDTGLEELRDHLVNDEQRDRHTGRRFRYAPRSVNKFLAVTKSRIRDIMNSDVRFTIGQQFQSERIIESVKGVTVQDGLDNRKLLTPAEVQAIIDGCPEGLRLIVRFLASTGCRISEALGIHLGDVSRVKGIYYIRVIGKGRGGGKVRTVNCKRELVDEIRAHFKGTSYLFEHNGKPFSRIYVTQRISAVAMRTINRSHVSAHCLRHAYATRYLEEHPEKLPKLSRYLGHASISTTQIYTHVSMSAEEAVAVAY